MKLYPAYRYKSGAAIIKVVLEHNPAVWVPGKLEVQVNQATEVLNIPGDYVGATPRIHFGINTYAYLDTPSGEILVRLRKDGALVSEFRLNIESDATLWHSIQTQMRRLPGLVGLPLDAAAFSALDGQFYRLPENQRFDQDGFVVLKNVLEPALLNRAIDELDRLTLGGFEGYQEGSSERIRNLHLLGGAFTQIFESQEIRTELSKLYGVEMLPCQTLTYKYGSQQGVHSDYVHLSTYPKNLMCGVWVALEDVASGAGELSVYRGSHKSPYFTMNDFGLKKIADNDYSPFVGTFDAAWSEEALRHEEVRALLKAGDILVWQANLLHAGNRRVHESLTRRSCVLHYFAKGAPVWYDSTGDIGFAGSVDTASPGR
jgi:hypothetical protein